MAAYKSLRFFTVMFIRPQPNLAGSISVRNSHNEVSKGKGLGTVPLHNFLAFI